MKRNDEEVMGFIQAFSEDSMGKFVEILDKNKITPDETTVMALTQLAAVMCMSRFTSRDKFLEGMFGWCDIQPKRMSASLKEWVLHLSEHIYTEEEK